MESNAWAFFACWLIFCWASTLGRCGKTSLAKNVHFVVQWRQEWIRIPADSEVARPARGVFVCAVGDRTGTLLMPIFGTISPLSSSLSSIPFTGWSISSSTQAKKEARLALWRRTIPCWSKLFTQPPWLVMLLSSEIKRRCLFLSTLGKKEGGNT